MASRSERGIRKPWISVPALLLLDALGLFAFGWAVYRLQQADAGLTQRADVLQIMNPGSFIMLLGFGFPIAHIIGWLAIRAQRQQKPVLRLHEKHWWLVLTVLIFGAIPLSWVADWAVGAPLRERAAAAGYIECDGLFDRLRPNRANTTYALSADLCRQAGFKRSRIEPGFDTPMPPSGSGS
jgi:hypothetical protein